MYGYSEYAWCPQRSERGIRSSGTIITDGCGLPYGFWELNQYPLQEQQVFLTNDPSLQLHVSLHLDTSLPTETSWE